MKLIKLTYIAHGWYLGLFDEPLLGEAVYAWKYGPVIYSLYRDFKKYKDSQISELYSPSGENNYPLPDKDIDQFLDTIWNVYAAYDGIGLSSLTHQKGTPWDIIWNEEGGKHKEDAVINNNLIKKYYKEKIALVNAKRAAPIVTAG